MSQLMQISVLAALFANKDFAKSDPMMPDHKDED